MRKRDMCAPFIVMTNYAEVQNAVLAIEVGGCRLYCEARPARYSSSENKRCPLLPPLVPPPFWWVRSQGSADSVADKVKAESTEVLPRHIEGKSEASRQLYSYVSLVAPTPMSVLILGASGTGKGVCGTPHTRIKCAQFKAFYALDCGAIPRDVAASEFFGHKKGAFTGADNDKVGAFQAANGGTLFLDEVGNLSWMMFCAAVACIAGTSCPPPVGSTEETAVDIRLVCATNENLETAVSEATLPVKTLYHRISEFTIYMPKLCERGSDLFLLPTCSFVANAELSRHVEGFDSVAAEMLCLLFLAGQSARTCQCREACRAACMRCIHNPNRTFSSYGTAA